LSNTCGVCKHGHETKPGGQRPSPGTVWCVHRGIQMAKNRSMQCFVALAGAPVKHCLDCKKAKKTRPTGETPPVGQIWCEKRHTEIHKQRSMDCFE
jgi:hypothetical protein